jgi:hemerythrin superfamily protein
MKEGAYMKLWDLLKHDHREVSTIYGQLQKAKDKSRLEELFAKLKAELLLHAQVEEAYFYPALKEHDQTKKLVKEAIEEHVEVKKMLTHLSSLVAGGDKFMELLKELHGNVEHHVGEEEKEIFPAAERALEKQQLDEIARKIAKEKQTAKTG